MTHTAGIGGGCNNDEYNSECGTVTVYGGKVEAYAGSDAAGIGSGEETFGGPNTNGGSLTVNGGSVYADDSNWGAGIGGGENSDGATVVVKEGSVTAWAGEDAGDKNGCAIGAEDGDGHRGSLRIDDNMMVHAGQNPSDADNHLFSSGERVPACYYRPYTRVEVCNHQGATYTVSGTTPDDTHTELFALSSSPNRNA